MVVLLGSWPKCSSCSGGNERKRKAKKQGRGKKKLKRKRPKRDKEGNAMDLQHFRCLLHSKFCINIAVILFFTFRHFGGWMYHNHCRLIINIFRLQLLFSKEGLGDSLLATRKGIIFEH